MNEHPAMRREQLPNAALRSGGNTAEQEITRMADDALARLSSQPTAVEGAEGERLAGDWIARHSMRSDRPRP